LKKLQLQQQLQHHSIAKQIIDQNAANAIVPPKQPNVLPSYQPQQPMPNKVNHPVPAAAQGESGNGSCANSSANSNSVETIFPGGAYMRGPPPQQRVEKESSPSSSNRVNSDNQNRMLQISNNILLQIVRIFRK